jgi:hypothetical protein
MGLEVGSLPGVIEQMVKGKIRGEVPVWGLVRAPDADQPRFSGMPKRDAKADAK